MAPSKFVLILLVAGPAWAGAPVDEARLLYKEAEALLQAGRPAAALLRYGQAYALVPTPMILLGEAEAYRDLRRPREGLAALRRVDVPGLPAAERARAAALRAELVALSSWPVELRPWSSDLALSRTARSRDTGASDRLSRSLGWSKWVAGVTGLALAAAGGVLLGVSDPKDARAIPAGALLLGAGVSGVTLSALFFGLDAGGASRSSLR